MMKSPTDPQRLADDLVDHADVGRRQHRQRVVLVIEDTGDPASADARLKRIVKATLRAHGWKLVSIQDTGKGER